jgi:hypothetical protein
MRIIDANTGIEPTIGKPFKNIEGEVTILKVREGIFSAQVLVDINGQRFWTPLKVRYLHPGFPFQKVGFIPS